MNKVLVTGATGFLGSHICEQFIAHKYAVSALLRKTSSTKNLEAALAADEAKRAAAGGGSGTLTLAYGDVTDETSLKNAVQGIDVVVHSAGLVVAKTPDDFYRVNVEGTRSLVEACVGAGVKKLVFVSSLTVAGPSSDGRPLAADAPYNPLTHYARSKVEAEKVVLAARERLHVTALRPPMIYGPRDPQSLKLFQSIQARVLPLPPQGPNNMSIVYAADCAAACVRAAESNPPSGQTYFLSDGHVYELKQMFEHAEQVLGTRAWLRVGLPMAVVAPAAAANHFAAKVLGRASMFNLDKLNELKQRHWVCDSAPAREQLGWTPKVDWAAGSAEAIAWYRKEGMLS